MEYIDPETILAEFQLADQLQTQANYWRKSAMTRLKLWAGQQQSEQDSNSPTAGCRQVALTTLTEQTSDSNESSKHGNNECPTPPCNGEPTTYNEQEETGLWPSLGDKAHQLRQLLQHRSNLSTEEEELAT